MATRTSSKTVSVHEIDRTLTLFSENQKQAFQENELRRLIFATNALDQKWLCKMILKRMNLGITTNKILKFYHPKGYQLFLKYNHLSRVVELVESGKEDAALVEVTEVFQPIRSMLCQKFTPTLNKDFMKCEMFQETKMDGERFQMHLKNGRYEYYSRNSHPYSDGFNELITPLIKFKPVVHSLILDGEMLVYDKHQKCYLTKGETPVDVKRMNDKGSHLRPCYCVFDVLLYNDQDFMIRPYSERHQLLHQLFEDREGVMVKTNPVRVRDAQHMVELFNKAIETEEEGIILKKADSKYMPGDRAGGWYKVKPDYFDGELVKEYDCVIIGGYYKNPFKKDFIQRYVLGVVEAVGDSCFNVYAVGEVVHGVTVQERMKINDTLKPHLIDLAKQKEVSFDKGKVFFGSNSPHVWLPPNKSLVLECRVSELARSSEHYTEYTFRFPRINAIRSDKIWDESCTMREFLDMCKTNDGRVRKVVQRSANVDDITSPQRKRKAAPSKATIIKEFCKAFEDDEEVEVIDHCLEGKQYCVMTTNASQSPSINDMVRTIRKHGGEITKLPVEGKTFIIIAGHLSKLAQKFMSDRCYNVIKPDWIVRNFGETGEKKLSAMPKIRPLTDVHFATEALKESWADEIDKHGDSFTEEIASADDLKLLIAAMNSQRQNMPKTCASDFAELDSALMGSRNINFFRDHSGAFFSLKDDNCVLRSAQSVLEFRAGKALELDRTNSIIFVDKSEDLKQIKRVLAERLIDYEALVDCSWILDSSSAGKVLDQNSYRL